MEQQTFDIETGMSVYGGNGQIIGAVTEIAGFGSTRIKPEAGSTGAWMTQAQSGTGYLKVESVGKDHLYVPFRGIEEVIPERGVYLTTRMLDELRCGGRTLERQIDITVQPQQQARNLGQRRRWTLPRLRRWLTSRPRPTTQLRSEGRTAVASDEVERGES